MKGREVIRINRDLTLQELCGFMQKYWDKKSYNDFIVGRPAAGAFGDYIMLPATPRCVVCVYPRKGKVILAVMTNPEGQATLAGSLVLGGYGRMGMVGEMNGVASQASELYAAYLESLFARAGMLSGDPKRKQPVLRQSDPVTGGPAGNVLELVKIAPPESRGISILSFVLGILSLVLFFTGIPGLLLGIIAVVAANSVLRVQAFSPRHTRAGSAGSLGCACHLLWHSSSLSAILSPRCMYNENRRIPGRWQRCMGAERN